MTTLKCNRQLFILIHQLQVQAFENHGLELTMEEALELFLISKLKTTNGKTTDFQRGHDNPNKNLKYRNRQN